MTRLEPSIGKSGHDLRPGSQTLLGIQYLRAIAAISVVFFHASFRSGRILIGEAGVDLFFLLSGFLMVAITTPQSRPGAFLVNRALRIVPIYWIATTFMLVSALVGLLSKVEIDPWHVIASYGFLPTYDPNNKIWPLLIPGWTLNFEMFFYLLFAITMMMGSQLRQMVTLSVMFSAFVIAGALFHPTSAPGRFYSEPIVLEFVLGGWIALAWKRPGEWPRAVGAILIVVGFALFVGVALLNTDRYRVLLFGVPAALILVGVLGIERRSPIRRYRIPLLLGDASYSIYLWHGFAISVAAKFCDVLHLPAVAILPLGVCGGISAGVIGFLAIERPIQRYIRQRRGIRRAPIPVTGSATGL